MSVDELYSNTHGEQVPDADRCIYMTGLRTRCGNWRIDEVTPYCHDHNEMIADGRLVSKPMSLEDFQRYGDGPGAESVNSGNENFKENIVVLPGTKQISVEDASDPMETVNKMREYAESVDSDLPQMLSGLFTSMEHCSTMANHQIIQQYRTAATEVMRMIEKRRSEQTTVDHVGDLIKKLEAINEDGTLDDAV